MDRYNRGSLVSSACPPRHVTCMTGFARLTVVLAAALMVAVQSGFATLACAADGGVLEGRPGQAAHSQMSEAAPPGLSPLLKNGEGKDLVRLITSGLVEVISA